MQISNCVFDGNKAHFFGGAILAQHSIASTVDLQIQDCVFQNNFCIFEDGGAIAAGLAGTWIRDTTFTGNTADDGGAVYGRPFVENCIFVENQGDYGGAIANGGTYWRCRFEDNKGHVSGGAAASVISNPLSHPRFINCEFIGNRTDLWDGGAAHGGTEFINCRFVGNFNGEQTPRGAKAGAIYVVVQANIVGCVFVGNVADGSGGAIDVPQDAVANVVNCTFAGNTTNDLGAAIHGPADIVNSIFWNHATLPIVGAASLKYSCAPLAGTPAGVGNIDCDPLFVDPIGPDGLPGTEDDDLRLAPNSPLIDAGDSTALPEDKFDINGDGNVTEPLPLDAFGNTRILELSSARNVGVPNESGAIIDMGFHEYRRPADIAPQGGNGTVNVDDLLMIILNWGPCPDQSPCAADLNADGSVTYSDLLMIILDWG